MFTLIIPSSDDTPDVELHLEHSLISMSKWEAKFEKPFYGKEGHNEEETRAYIGFMCLDGFPSDSVLMSVSYEAINRINAYINSKQSATTFSEDPNAKQSREVITTELIYYWLVAFRIPFHPAESWHVSRLMNLVKIAGIKQTKPKKMSPSQQAEYYRKLNAERRQQLGTNG